MRPVIDCSTISPDILKYCDKDKRTPTSFRTIHGAVFSSSEEIEFGSMTLRADTPLDAMMRESQGQGEVQVAVLGSSDG